MNFHKIYLGFHFDVSMCLVQCVSKCSCLPLPIDSQFSQLSLLRMCACNFVPEFSWWQMVVFYVGKVFREMFFTCYKSDQGFNFLIQKNAVRGVLNDDCSMNCYYRDHFIYIINFSGDAYFSLDPFSFFGRFFSVSSVGSFQFLR